MKRNKRQTNIEKPLIPIKVSEYPPYFHDGERILKGDTSLEALLASVTDEYFVMPLPENISALDKASNGWHRYSSTYVIKKMNFLKDSIIIEHLPAILESSINSIDEESVDSKPYFFLFWETVAHVIGPASLKYLYEMFDELFEEPLNEATATALSDFMQGYLVSFPYWEPEDILEFEKRILFPYIIISSQNPTVSDITEYVFLLCSSFIDARRLYPLIQFMFKNCDSSPEGNLTRRRLFEILMTVISWQCPSFYTSVDLLFNRFIVPYLENSHEYSTSQSSSIIYIFMSLIESTCIPTYSPKYSPELKETRAFLIDSFNNLIKNNDPTQKFYHQTLSVFLQYMDTSSLIAVESMMPIYLDNLENILIAINSSDISTEDILESSFSSFLLHPIFTQNVHFAVEIIQKVLKNFDILSPPMQLKMIQSFTDMLRTIVHSISKDDLKTLYELFLNLAKQTKNENVLLEIMAIIGLVLKFSDPVENMDKIEAASIIVVALLFDEVDQQVLRAFEILKEIVESSSNNQNIIKNVIQKFWAMNADHMLPQVAEQLSVYRLLISPSYIS